MAMPNPMGLVSLCIYRGRPRGSLCLSKRANPGGGRAFSDLERSLSKSLGVIVLRQIDNSTRYRAVALKLFVLS
jgi:hypothetical protein